MQASQEPSKEHDHTIAFLCHPEGFNPNCVNSLQSLADQNHIRIAFMMPQDIYPNVNLESIVGICRDTYSACCKIIDSGEEGHFNSPSSKGLLNFIKRQSQHGYSEDSLLSNADFRKKFISEYLDYITKNIVLVANHEWGSNPAKENEINHLISVYTRANVDTRQALGIEDTEFSASL